MKRAPRNTGSRRARVLALNAVLAVIVVLLGTRRASAYPWMIKHGYTACGTCHADPSGGELLTAYGRVISDEILRTHFKKKPDSQEGTASAPATEGHEYYQQFFGAFGTPESLLLGGSVRIASLYRDTDTDKFRVFPMQVDLQGEYTFLDRLHVGGSLGVAKVAVAERAMVLRFPLRLQARHSGARA